MQFVRCMSSFVAHHVISRSHQLRRFRREADIGFGGSRDLSRSATSGRSRTIGVLLGRSPRKPMVELMPSR